MSGKNYHFVSYGVGEDGRIDYAELEKQVKKVRPRMIVAGASAYPRAIDFEKLAEIAHGYGAFLMVDMAHIAGLVAGGMHQSPVPYADVVTTTTHKTLRGPRGGLILTNNAVLAKRINSAVFPGTQGGPLEHVIAAKAVCFGEALKPEFKDYARKIVENAQAMAAELQARGVKLVSGGTDNHLMLLDLRDEECTGKELEARLDSVHITANKNTVPGETRSPFVTSGVRLGTPAVTTRGMGEAEMKVIADCIADCIWHYDEKKDDISARVLALTKAFPVRIMDFDVSKPLHSEEVSPKVTERASSVPKNICTAISISFFVRVMLSACVFISLQRPCPLRRCAPAPKGRA